MVSAPSKGMMYCGWKSRPRRC